MIKDLDREDHILLIIKLQKKLKILNIETVNQLSKATIIPKSNPIISSK